MLEAIGSTIQESVPNIMDILQLVNPIAESLIHNYGYKNHDAKKLLQEARTFDQLLGEVDEEGDISFKAYKLAHFFRIVTTDANAPSQSQIYPIRGSPGTFAHGSGQLYIFPCVSCPGLITNKK